MLPTLVLRAYGFCRYRKRDPLDFKDLAFYISIFYNASYGCWTIYNIYTFLGISTACKQVHSLSLVNFQIALIFGCFPAVNVLFVTLLLLIFIPCYLGNVYKDRRAKGEKARRTKELMKSLISKRYDPRVFQGRAECAVCLDEFATRPDDADPDLSKDPSYMVTPLPCSNFHFFHTSCIKEWMRQQDNCPLCKK